MKQVWQRIKTGAPPVMIMLVITLIVMGVVGYINGLKIPFTHVDWLDVLLNISLLLAACYADSYLITKKWFQDLAKETLVKIPMAGPIIVRALVPNEHLQLVEIQTYDGNWEYALVLHAWRESLRVGEAPVGWYRVHTFGIGPGKMFSRIHEKNVLTIPPEKQRDTWVTIISFGLIAEAKEHSRA